MGLFGLKLHLAFLATVVQVKLKHSTKDKSGADLVYQVYDDMGINTFASFHPAIP